MMETRRFLTGTTLVAGTLYATVGHAHVGHHAMAGFEAGLLHPLTGLDHLVAMLAVGLLAGRQGGRAAWALPAMFVGVLVVAAVTAMSGVVVVGAEVGVMASVIVAGLLLVAPHWGPLSLIAAVTALVAMVHGYIHGFEAAAAGSGMFLLGLALITAILVGAGVLAGRSQTLRPASRLAGATMVAGALAGVF